VQPYHKAVPEICAAAWKTLANSHNRRRNLARQRTIAFFQLVKNSEEIKRSAAFAGMK
jgi:hypothetical protein